MFKNGAFPALIGSIKKSPAQIDAGPV